MKINFIKTQSIVMAGLLFLSCNAFSADKTVTIEGVVAAGTLDSVVNTDAGGAIVFMTDSDIANKIFNKCKDGDRCKITAVVEDSDFKSVISVEKVGESQPITLTTTASTKDKPKPSFDCSKASTFIEKSICSDSNLSNLDNSLMSSYKKVYAATKNQESLKNEQKSWLKNVRNKCQNNKCLEDAYNSRLSQLNKISQ